MMFQNTLASLPDPRHRLRQWRWFRMAFRRHASEVRDAFGIGYEIDDVSLARVFFDWLESLDELRAHLPMDRSDLIVLAAGVLLRELLRGAPVDDHSAPGQLSPAKQTDEKASGMADIARFWPEGFLYTSFCIFGVSAVSQQDGDRPVEPGKFAEDLRFWWSFKENAKEMPSLAIPFLHRMVDREPNWIMPDAPAVGSLLHPGRSTLRLPA
ncbi:hypothetical protein [Chelativorans sp. Marseille-P2723]|uniref:hypothetical protein n=1 Tax=Chelativorans sp. Marseille-P2723 TaxID=2709133 RepID=UPI00156D6606|nr:hypothetical protein [Chelativorans sp. Marseille-P2723]